MMMYKKLLSQLLSDGYQFLKFASFEEAKSGFVLRHDIDFSLTKALKMARLEARLGVASTYFLMMDSPFYNLLEKEQREIVREICDCGHDVGLHFDPSLSDDINTELERSIQLFEWTIDKKIDIISFHRPREILKRNLKFQNIRHCYEPEFFQVENYVSDSAGSIGRIFDYFLQTPNTSKGQILIHPLWWDFSKRDMFDIKHVYSELISSSQEKLETNAKINCGVFNV